MKIILVVIYCLLEISLAFSQGERNNWMIADSIRISFSNGSCMISYQGSNTSYENMSSISDKNGDLLFYSGFNYNPFLNPTTIFDSTHTAIPGGIIANNNTSLTQGSLFLPHPDDSNLVYFIYTEIIQSTPISVKLKYCVIDKTLNNGMGAVIQNNMTASDSSGTEMIAACKHANGRDWWIIRHSKNNYSQFNILLLTPSGFASEQYQVIPNMPIPGIYGVEIGKFSKEGDVFCLAGYYIDALFVFDFDRCTGVLSNNRELGGPNYTTFSPNGYYGVEISPNGRFVYACKVTNISDTIVQFDLQASNPKADRRKIFVAKDSLSGSNHGYFFTGQFLLGPDDRIYIARGNEIGSNYNFSIVQARSLSVINNPDLKDSLCNFDPYSIPVPTRLRIGLPNLPYYALGPLIGSPCDTLTAGLDEGKPAISPSIHAMYNTSSGSINLYAQGLRGKYIKMMLYDLQGRLIKTAQGKTNTSYFTYTLKVNDLRNALYIIHLQSEKEVLSVKVMVE